MLKLKMFWLDRSLNCIALIAGPTPMRTQTRSKRMLVCARFRWTLVHLGKARDRVLASVEQVFSKENIGSYIPWGDAPEVFENSSVSQVMESTHIELDDVDELPDFVVVNGQKYVPAK